MTVLHAYSKMAKSLQRLKKSALRERSTRQAFRIMRFIFMCFMGTEMDGLAVGNFVLYKAQQDAALKENYEERYELD